MAPWERYGQQGPWARYAPPQGPSAGETMVDVAKSLGGGLARGAAGLAGLPGDLYNIVDKSVGYLGGKLGFESGPSEQPALLPGSATVQKGVESITGEFHKPTTTAGEFASTIGEFAPAAIAGPGGILRRAASQAVAPAIASEGAGQLTKGTAAEPYARIAGALAGGLAPSAIGRAISPLPIDPTRQAAVNTLRAEGVTDLTAGQITGRKPLQYLEAERGRGANLIERQGEQFTRAALRRVGENANRATPEVIDRAFTRIGGEFDRLAANNVAVVDQQLVNGLRAARDDYFNLVSPPNRTPAVTNFLTELATAAQRNGGQVPGNVYQSLRSRMERAARGMGNNPEARHAIREMREALDDAMERSIARSNPNDLGAWRDARNQYRNLLVIEKAATGAGEGAAVGLISPAKLREATVNTQGRRNYARGQGDFTDLARSGVALMTPLPNSGTPGRLSAQNLGMGISSLLGGAAGAASGGGSEGTMAGMIAGALLPRAIGRAATSRVGRAYLANQTAAPMLNAADPRTAAVIAALMAAEQQRLAAPQ